MFEKRKRSREAGLGGPGDPDCTRLLLAVVETAKESLSEEDKFIVAGGRGGRDPFAAET